MALFPRINPNLENAIYGLGQKDIPAMELIQRCQKPERTAWRGFLSLALFQMGNGFYTSATIRLV